MKLSKYFIKRPTLFWSLMVAIILGGIYSYSKMPKLEDPEISIKQANVVVLYPGASAHEVELEAVAVLEEALRSMPEVNYISSESSNGMGLVTVEMKMTVPESQVQQYWDLLRRKVNDVSAMLPSGCSTPMVIDDVSDVYGMFYALKAEGYDNREMTTYAEYLRRNLLGVNGVKRVTLFGSRDECINITLPKENLARNGMTATQIMTGIDAAHKTVEAGKYEAGNNRIQLRVSEQLKDEKDIENLLIKTMTGEQIRLGDIAQVERGYLEPQNNGFWVDGKPAIAILLSTEPGVNVTEVGKRVEARMAELMTTLPAGFESEKIFFQPDKVNKAIDSFLVNLIESVLIVVFALVFTMGFRSGLIIGSGLILTIAASFPVLLMLGTTLQRISLGAFIIAMGMLVDNAIVILDGILIDKRRGLAPKKYLFNICRKTAWPLLGATLIASSTFLCVFLAKGSASEYAHDLFLVLCVSLLISWLLAMTQVPMFAKNFLPPRIKEHPQGQDEVLNKPIHRFVRKMTSFLVDHKKVTLAVSVSLLVLAGWSFRYVKNLYFPDFDYNQFVVEYWMPSQTNPEKVRHDLLEITDRLKEKYPQIQRITASQESAPARYCLVRPMTNGGDCYGELLVDCEDFNTCSEIIPSLRAFLRAEYPDAYIRTRRYNFSISTSHTVEVQFKGPDPAVLRRLSAEAEQIMREAQSVDPYSVQNNWKERNKSLVAYYQQMDGRRTGINRSDVGNALMAATDGLTVGALHDKDKIVRINLQIRNADGSKIQDLNDVPVWTMMPNINLSDNDMKVLLSGGMKASDVENELFKSSPLSNVTKDLDLAWEEGTVYRYDCMRAIEAECDPDYDNGSSPVKVQKEIQEKIESIPLPPGYSMRWMGEIKQQAESNEALADYYPLTLIIVLTVLLLLFNDWRKVILILICLPFVIVGVAPALIATGLPFTFMATIGMAGLMGMMIKNSIVLVDEINRLMTEEGLHPYHAIIQATVARANPVIMASATTIVGMLPLVSDPMYGSMAVSIMAGLTMGTIITLMLLPVFYAIFFKVTKPQTEE